MFCCCWAGDVVYQRIAKLATKPEVFLSLGVVGVHHHLALLHISLETETDLLRGNIYTVIYVCLLTSVRY